MIVGLALPHTSRILLSEWRVIMVAVGAAIGSMALAKMVTGVRITTTSFNGRSGEMTRALWFSIRKDMKGRSITLMNTAMV